MNKQEILKDYKNQEDKLIIAQLLDKVEFSRQKNKIEHTDFLNLHEQDIVDRLLKKLNFKNYYFFGGKEDTERKLCILYPEKITEEMSKKNDGRLLKIIRIKLPNELEDEYDHKVYLGGIMKLGIDRCKVGDIIVENLGADIIVKDEAVKFLNQNIPSLTRFSKAEIEIKEIDEIKNIELQKQELNIIVLSLRLDSIVSELAHTSRGKAVQILEQERVFLNFQNETKPSKQVKVGDIITIRGKGKFEFVEIAGNTRKGRYVLKINKYV